MIQTEKRCYFCGGYENLHCHHIYGAFNRDKSEKNGFVVWLCAYHHNLGGNGKCVHQCREDFRRLIGKSYL